MTAPSRVRLTMAQAVVRFLSQQRTVRDGREQPLIPRYFDLLVFLVEHRREAVHRRDIFDRVWSDVIVSDSSRSTGRHGQSRQSSVRKT